MLLVFSIKEKTAIIHWASGCLLFLKINTGTAAYKTTFPEIFPCQIFNINSLHVDDILVLDVYHLSLNITSDKLNFGWTKCTPSFSSELNTYVSSLLKEGKGAFPGSRAILYLAAQTETRSCLPKETDLKSRVWLMYLVFVKWMLQYFWIKGEAGCMVDFHQFMLLQSPELPDQAESNTNLLILSGSKGSKILPSAKKR